MRPYTLGERRRLYLLARLVVKRRYCEPLTLSLVAKTLASSPRQIQRVYAQFGSTTFREDLLARRMTAAAQLLSQPAIPVRDVARLVGYSQPPHFAQMFSRHYGVSPTVFRATIGSRTSFPFRSTGPSATARSSYRYRCADLPNRVTFSSDTARPDSTSSISAANFL
jgi:AraC family transcriptional regulator, regulatory protein of adaptative response / methylphosphotriester-DNA alkyltransferase methyltransferase